MKSFIVVMKTIWELIKAFKDIKAFYDKKKAEELDKENTKRAAKLRATTEVIEAETRKPVEQVSNDSLREAHRNRRK